MSALATVVTQTQFDRNRNRLSVIVREAGWSLVRIEQDTATLDAFMVAERFVDGHREKCKLRLEFSAPFEDTLKRIAVHLKMKG